MYKIPYFPGFARDNIALVLDKYEKTGLRFGADRDERY